MTATAPLQSVARKNDFVLSGPVGSFDAYMDKVSRIPVLSREDEAALAVRFRNDGDLDAARELVLSHLRFVVHIARGYSGYGLPLGDVVQEGNVGLMKAVKRFDPTVGVRLVSFAVHWIRAEIHEYVLRNWRLVKVATTKAQRKLFFNLRKMKKNLAWLSHEETLAVARDLKVTPAEVTEMEKRLAARDLSFDPVPDAGSEDGDETYSPAAYLPAPDADPATADRKRRVGRHHGRSPGAGHEDARRARPRHPREPLDRRGESDAARSRREIRRVGRAHPPDRGECDQEAARPDGGVRQTRLAMSERRPSRPPFSGLRGHIPRARHVEILYRRISATERSARSAPVRGCRMFAVFRHPYFSRETVVTSRSGASARLATRGPQLERMLLISACQLITQSGNHQVSKSSRIGKFIVKSTRAGPDGRRRESRRAHRSRRRFDL